MTTSFNEHVAPKDEHLMNNNQKMFTGLQVVNIFIEKNTTKCEWRYIANNPKPLHLALCHTPQ